MRKLIFRASVISIISASAGFADAPEVLLPGSDGFDRVMTGKAGSGPSLNVEATIDAMMPEQTDPAFNDHIRDYHRAALSSGDMAPGDLIRMRLARRHAATMPALDPERIRQMARIDMTEEYRPGRTLDIRPGNFDLEAEPDLSGKLDSADDLEAFLATQDGMEMVSGMSEAQFKALTRLLRELKEEELQNDDPEGRTIGDGTNLALRGWRVEHDGSEVRAYHESTPGSGLIIETGMVMGEFGRVTDIRISGQDVAVAFETGATLESRGSDLFEDGIPALDADLTASASDPETETPVGDIIVTRRAEQVASLPEGGTAPTTSLRPMSRPVERN